MSYSRTTHASRYRSGYALSGKRATRRGSGARPMRRALVIGMALLAGTIGITWGWSFTDITVDGASYVPNATVRDAALVVMAERRWGIVPRRSIAVGGLRAALRKTLHEQFVLADIHMEHIGRVLAVRVVEPPLAAVLFTASGGSAFVTTDGSLVQARSDRTREDILVSEQARDLLVFSWGVPLETLGAHPVDPVTIAAVRTLWTILRQEAGPALIPTHAVPKYGNAADIDIITASGAVVSLTTREPPERQAEKLRAVLHDRAKPEQRAAVRSIDLRFGDRVYVQ